MASPHGRKPPNPQFAPKSHGRKPPAPSPHRSSGKGSSSATNPQVALILAIFLPLPILFIGSIIYVILSRNEV